MNGGTTTSWRVLVVDDEHAVGIFTTLVLGRAGIETDYVTTAETALQRLDAASWDALLVDVGLPAMGGMELARRARVAYPGLAIVVMSARGGPAVDAQARSHGADSFIAKPLSPSTLPQAVVELIAWRQLVVSQDWDFGVIEAGPGRLDQPGATGR